MASFKVKIKSAPVTKTLDEDNQYVVLCQAKIRYIVFKLCNWRETEPVKNVKTKEITEDMELDKSPFFRRIITPWYDSDPVCWILILWALSVLIFTLVGLEIAISTPPLNRYIWFPSMLAGLSLILIISVTFRMIRRNMKG